MRPEAPQGLLFDSTPAGGLLRGATHRRQIHTASTPRAPPTPTRPGTHKPGTRTAPLCARPPVTLSLCPDRRSMRCSGGPPVCRFERRAGSPSQGLGLCRPHAAVACPRTHRPLAWRRSCSPTPEALQGRTPRPASATLLAKMTLSPVARS